MKRCFRSIASLALAAALFLSAGCGANSYSNTAAASSSAAVARGVDMAPMAVSQETAAMDTAGGEAGGVLPPSLNLPDSAGRKIIWTVNMSLETLEFDSAIGGLTNSIQEAGGYIESSSVSGQSLEGYGGRRRHASITARVPQEKLEAFLGAVSAVCNVVSTDRQSEDVTLQYTDIETRKRSLEVEQERLLELLGEADSVDTIVALESRLSEIRYQLDSYTSSLRTYDSLVDYSTVHLNLSEVLRISEPVPQTLLERMRSGLANTGRNLVDGTQDLLVWVVVNFPYLLIWAAVIAVLAFVLRRFRLRRKRAVPKASAEKTGQEAAGTEEGKQD
ncbi:MAG: DUF4349 domain-containing protein [Provencibacterium sp.]|nr:DUF4349 domain-containing protein [Provencibacterium sp.]